MTTFIRDFWPDEIKFCRDNICLCAFNVVNLPSFFSRNFLTSIQLVLHMYE